MRMRILTRPENSWRVPNPKGPKIEKIQDRPPGLKFSIEIEISISTPSKPLFFVGNSEGQD